MSKSIIKFRIYGVIFLLAGAICGGCTNQFEKWNTNPQEATEDMMQQDNLLVGAFFTQMEKNVFRVGEGYDSDYQITQNLAGDIYSGYMGACGNWNSNRNNATYALISGWYSAAFNFGFTQIMQPWLSIKKSAEKESPQVLALATIVKIVAMQRVTDMYGPIPYTGFGGGTLTNKYDSQKDVYYAFFNELNQAIQVLTNYHDKSPDAKIMSKYDLIFNGNTVEWIRFANSLKLRLAMRIVYADPEKAKTEAESAVGNTIGVMTSVSDVAALQHTSGFSYRHPLYVICYEFNDTRMGATMDSYLNGYKDPRLPKYFNAANDGKFRGIRNGIDITNKATYAEGPYSKLNVVPSTPVVWMNPAETWFLRAEGAIRGWNMGGTPKDLYEKGIQISFDYYSAGSASSYIANNLNSPINYDDPANGSNNSISLSKITVKWDDSAPLESKLEKIITQKWIAVYPDGQEAWSEFRRTGYPKVFPNVLNYSGGTISTDVQIRRLPFPTSEYQQNKNEVDKAVSMLTGADNGGTRLWWDKK